MPDIGLTVHVCATGTTYLVVFTGPHAETHAIAFIERKAATCVISESKARPLDQTFTKVLATLYPACHHGMDGRLCMDPHGPHHFGTREQDLFGM